VYRAVVNRIVAAQNTVCTLCSCYAATRLKSYEIAWQEVICQWSSNGFGRWRYLADLHRL